MASYDDTATVSGNIVRVNDGADSVPLKNWLVTLPASLDGYTSIAGTKSGKNLLPNKTYQRNANTLRLGTDTLDGRLSLKAGTYTLSITSDVAIGTLTYTLGGTSTNITFTSSGTRYYGSFTLSADTDDIFMHVYKSGGITAENVSDFMLEVGNTPTQYTAYTAPTTYTASLGRTIYGGTPDLVNGQGSDNTKKIKLNTLSWQYNDTEYSYGYFDAKYNQTDMSGNMNFQVTEYINNQNPRSALANGEVGVYNKGNAIKRLVIRDDSCTSLEQFLEKIADYDFVYECTDTPTSFTFDPVTIETSKGSNTFWSEQGNTELAYYKDGYGFTSVTVHKETPEGEPVEQTAKLHKIVYGGLVDVISGKCEPKNLFVKDNPNEVDGYFTTTGFSTGNANAKTVYIPIVGGETYTVSKTAGQRFQIATAEVIPSNGASYTGRQANNTASSLTITASANDKYLWAWVFLDGTDTGTLADMLSSVQIEKGSSASEYVPGFTPFTFPPISMETDEGENTLFADEGDSAITYRKVVD